LPLPDDAILSPVYRKKYEDAKKWIGVFNEQLEKDREELAEVVAATRRRVHGDWASIKREIMKWKKQQVTEKDRAEAQTAFSNSVL